MAALDKKTPLPWKRKIRQCVTSERWMGKAEAVSGGGQPHRKFSLFPWARTTLFPIGRESAVCERGGGGDSARGEEGRGDENVRSISMPFATVDNKLLLPLSIPPSSSTPVPLCSDHCVSFFFSLPSSLLSPGYSRRSALAVSRAKPEKWIYINLTNCFWVRSISSASTYPMFISFLLHAMLGKAERTKRILTIHCASNTKSIVNSASNLSY